MNSKKHISNYKYPILFVLVCSCFWVGCDKPDENTAQNSNKDTDKQESKQDYNNDDKKSYMEQAQDLFQQAKEAGQTTAANAGDWVSETVSGAMETTGNVAQDTGDWVTDTFETLRDGGMTTANNTTQWVQDDFKNMNSFEYKVLVKDPEQLANLEEQLNEMGAKRWECFAVDDQAFYFKRQKKSYLRNVPVKDLLKFLPLSGGDE